MRIIIIILSFIIFNVTIYSQKETFNWIMPIKTGLNFNTKDTTPEISFLNSTLDGNNLLKSCSVISDNSGRLLFYAGGGGGELISKYVFIWNKENHPMHNSYDMSKSKNVWGVYCFPVPGKGYEYYTVFTGIAPHGSSNIYKSIGYSIIDMKGDQGNGSVISSIPEDIYKLKERDDYHIDNALLIKHNNNLDVWLVTKGNFRGLSEYGIVSYLFTNKGINDTVEKRFSGFTIDFFKSSIDGKKLVFAETFSEQDTSFYYEYEVSLINILNFDNTNGKTSIYRYFRACDSCRVLNVEFSPDDSKLYTIELEVYKKASDYIFTGTRLFQYDLSKNSIEEMILTKKQIGKTIPWDTSRAFWGNGSYFDLKVAPDGKIYIIRLWSPFLSAIENPNEKGSNVKFIDTAINFVDRNVSFFPTFLNNYYNTHLSITTDSSFCEGDTLIIEAGLSDNTYKSSYTWTGPKGEIYDTPKITIPNCNVSHSGIYRLVVDVNGAKLHDSVMIKIISNPVPLIKGSKEAYIKTIEEYSTTDNMDYYYFWEVEGGNILSNPNRSRISVRWDSVGNCFVKLNRTNIKTGCVSSSQLEVIVREFPEAIISGDSSACKGDTLSYNTFFNQNLTYNWELKGFRPISSLNESNIRIVCDTVGYGQIKLIRKNKITEDIDSVERFVLIHQRPEKPLIKLNPDTTLEATAGGYRYKWFKDGKLISEQSENKIKLESTGKYSVILIDQNGCESELSDIIEIILSNKEIGKQKNSITISPNPAEEYIEISGLNKGLQPLVPEQEIKIYNLLGECMINESIHPMTSSHRMNIERLPAGLYFVRVGDWVGRFVKI
jgi:hypothetical protein